MRNKSLLLFLPVILLMAGCATCDKKVKNLETRVQTLENKGAPLEEETLSEAQITAETTASLVPQEKAIPASPSKKDIQAALKNAGFYTGKVDGKIGKKTKEAIKEFQKVNGLKADGKVGPKTWDKLKTYLDPATGTTQTTEGKE